MSTEFNMFTSIRILISLKWHPYIVSLFNVGDPTAQTKLIDQTNKQLMDLLDEVSDDI